MKKLSTLILLTVLFLSNASYAQNNPCEPGFRVSYQNNHNIHFHPIIHGNPSTTIHSWIFGDGNLSNLVSPIHNYQASGAYTVKHIIKRYSSSGALLCRDSATRVIQVHIPVFCTLEANFTSTVVATPANSFSFQNTTTPASATDSAHWNFGDGTSSTDVSPTHTFPHPGRYTVCLRMQQRDATGALTSCVREKCREVIVLPPPCLLVVDFTSAAVTTTANTLSFTNTTTPLSATDSAHWNFGDGTSSTDVSPTHTFPHPGRYTVCLRMQQRDANGALTSCVREKCREVIVLAPPCTLVVDFTSTAVTTPANSFNFQNTTTPANATDSVHWNFGDGTSSTDINPATHTYTQPGNYWVCLRVQQRDANGALTSCVREKCQRITAGTPNPGICTLQPFPNPVSTSVSVSVSLTAPQMIDVYIYNLRNVLVKEKHQAGLTGNNTVNITTGDLPFGIYFMKVVHGTETCYATFLKI